MRKRRLITVAAAALLAGAIAAGVSYATIPGPGNVYSACMLKGIGTIRLIDKSLPDSNLMSRCKSSLEIEVSWNQKGQDGVNGANGTNGADGKDGADGNAGANGANGADGVSVTSAAEPAGGNCAHGGSKFTAANGVTYACNAAPGVGGGSGWGLTGNGGTNGTNYLGTSDEKPLNFRVNGIRALRLEPAPGSPNVIGGLEANRVDAFTIGATIGGGGYGPNPNRVTYDWGTVAGGLGNTAHYVATVAGGFANAASGSAASVAGGSQNTASGMSATVAGGELNVAGGAHSFAAGRRASAMHDGSFTWADRTGGFGSTADNEFSVRATGGVRFVSGSDGSGNSTGVSLAPGSGSWSNLSDRAMKRNFAAVEGAWVLERLAGLPISTWSYKAQKPSIRHLGPTAQDFRRAFGLGVDSRHIDSIDSEGVSLAGVKALYELVQAQQREIDVLKRQVARLERRGQATTNGPSNEEGSR